MRCKRILKGCGPSSISLWESTLQHRRPEYHLARAIIKIVKPEMSEFETTDPFIPFIEKLNSIISLKLMTRRISNGTHMRLAPIGFSSKTWDWSYDQGIQYSRCRVWISHCAGRCRPWDQNRDYMFYDGDVNFVSRTSFKKVSDLCQLTSRLHSDDGTTPFTPLETARLDISDTSNWVITGISFLDGGDTHDWLLQLLY